jgi:hypothetical protein
MTTMSKDARLVTFVCERAVQPNTFEVAMPPCIDCGVTKAERASVAFDNPGSSSTADITAYCAALRSPSSWAIQAAFRRSESD